MHWESSHSGSIVEAEEFIDPIGVTTIVSLGFSPALTRFVLGQVERVSFRNTGSVEIALLPVRVSDQRFALMPIVIREHLRL